MNVEPVTAWCVGNCISRAVEWEGEVPRGDAQLKNGRHFHEKDWQVWVPSPLLCCYMRALLPLSYLTHLLPCETAIGRQSGIELPSPQHRETSLSV